MQQTSRRSSPVAAILAIAGGAIMAIGSFLTWAEVSGGGTSVTTKGTDGSDGWITFGAGLVLVLAGVIWLMRGTGKKAVAILALFAAMVGGGLGLYDALTAKDTVLDDAAEELAGQFGASVSEVRTLLDQAVDAGQIGISLSIGIYLVIAGGAVGIVAGILGMRRGSSVAAPISVPGSAPETPAPDPSVMPAAAPGSSSMPAPAGEPPPVPGVPPDLPPPPAPGDPTS